MSAEDDIVRLLYEGVFDDGAVRAAIEKIATTEPDGYVLLLHARADGGRADISMYANADPADAALYEERYFALDPGRHFVGTFPKERVFSTSEFIDGRAFLRSEIYNDFFRGLNDVRDRQLVDFGSGSTVGLLTYGIPAARAERTADRVRATLEVVRPHLQRVASLRASRHRHDARTRTAFVHASPVAALVMTTDGAIAEANDAAHRLLGGAPGAEDRPARLPAEELARAARHLARSDRPTGSCVLADGRGRPAFAARLVLVRPSDSRLSVIERDYAGVPNAHVIAFVNAVGAPASGLFRALADAYGFTPSEAALVGLLVEGHALAEAAERLGRSRNTARNQLASAMSKAQVRRQADLIRLLARYDPP